jgi:putative transposase
MAIHVGQSLKGNDVVTVMEQLQVIHLAVPSQIQVDNGSDRAAGAVYFKNARFVGV